MAIFILVMAYLSVFSFVIGLFPVKWEHRPKLRALEHEAATTPEKGKNFNTGFRAMAAFNKPLCTGAIRRRIIKDMSVAHVNMTPEEYFLLKEIIIIGLMFATSPIIEPELFVAWIGGCIAVGFIMPEFWLKGRIRRSKSAMVRELPDAIDLLGLCVNAGLDFMLALKWVVDKSAKSVLVEEFNTVMQEINVGKTRRDALKDLAAKYDLPDLASFSRTLIQADKMGTSVSEALNLLSEDMRMSRFRRGEQIALKAPLKMLIPLLLFIFPVVGALVMAPIILDFSMNNPIQALR